MASKTKVSAEYNGKFDIPYSRASMQTDRYSEAIGAGDVGNPFDTCDDASVDSYPTMGVPDHRDNPVKRKKGERHGER